MAISLVEVLFSMIVGAIVGVVALKLAPGACKQFQQYSLSSRSIPLHIFGMVMFTGLCCLGAMQHNYVSAIVSGLLALLSVSGLLVVYCGMSLPKAG